MWPIQTSNLSMDSSSWGSMLQEQRGAESKPGRGRSHTPLRSDPRAPSRHGHPTSLRGKENAALSTTGSERRISSFCFCCPLLSANRQFLLKKLGTKMKSFSVFKYRKDTSLAPHNREVHILVFTFRVYPQQHKATEAKNHYFIPQ